MSDSYGSHDSIKRMISPLLPSPGTETGRWSDVESIVSNVSLNKTDVELIREDEEKMKMDVGVTRSNIMHAMECHKRPTSARIMTVEEAIRQNARLPKRYGGCCWAKIMGKKRND